MPAQVPGFGEQLRRYREQAGLTREALAERAGLTASGIAALERGRRRRPYPDTVWRLCEALALSAEERAGFGTAVRLPAEPAAAPTPPTPVLQSNLPAPRTRLICREEDVAALRDFLLQPETRLLTLTGVGGCGKTRLALQVATELRDAGVFPDGVWLVELAAVTDPALVPHAVARILGCRTLRTYHSWTRLGATSAPVRSCSPWTTASTWWRPAPSWLRDCSPPAPP